MKTDRAGDGGSETLNRITNRESQGTACDGWWWNWVRWPMVFPNYWELEPELPKAVPEYWELEPDLPEAVPVPEPPVPWQFQFSVQKREQKSGRISIDLVPPSPPISSSPSPAPLSHLRRQRTARQARSLMFRSSPCKAGAASRIQFFPLLASSGRRRLCCSDYLLSGTLFSLQTQVLSVVGLLQDDVDPMVSFMKVEKAPLESYTDIGGLDCLLNNLFSANIKKQTVFFLQTADVYSTSSAAEGCRCGPQTADVLASKKQIAPKVCISTPIASPGLGGSPQIYLGVQEQALVLGHVVAFASPGGPRLGLERGLVVVFWFIIATTPSKLSSSSSLPLALCNFRLIRD
ncbi:hypothetical protein LXL04_028330 [Taraxacum kok-saghyz]